ncbi:hypothetical protein BH23ACT6_BH23ACT6_14300 [soil metagenome]
MTGDQPTSEARDDGHGPGEAEPPPYGSAPQGDSYKQSPQMPPPPPGASPSANVPMSYPNEQQGVQGPAYQGQPGQWAQAGQRPQMQVAPKNPAVHVLVSFFLPGVGTMLNGETAKGLILLTSYLVCLFLGFLLSFILIGFLFFPFVIGLWIWGMVDAYLGAQKWNARHGIIS